MPPADQRVNSSEKRNRRQIDRQRGEETPSQNLEWAEYNVDRQGVVDCTSHPTRQGGRNSRQVKTGDKNANGQIAATSALISGARQPPFGGRRCVTGCRPYAELAAMGCQDPGSR